MVWNLTGVLGAEIVGLGRLPDLAAASPTEGRRGVPGRGELTGRTGIAAPAVALLCTKHCKMLLARTCHHGSNNKGLLCSTFNSLYDLQVIVRAR